MREVQKSGREKAAISRSATPKLTPTSREATKAEIEANKAELRSNR